MSSSKPLSSKGPRGFEGEAFADAELAHGGRDEDRAGGGVIAGACRELDGGAEQVVVLGDGFAGAHADAHLDRVLGVGAVRVRARVGSRSRSRSRARPTRTTP